MHTARELASSSFAIAVAGRRATLADVFPGFGERDRLGVVVRRPCGAVGASALILATITAFYDIQRARSEDFFIYPDYYLFHVGRRLGDHNMLDIFPAHKEVVVGDGPEGLLEAINDRAVTRLLVEDVEPEEPFFERPALASARRIVTALAYSSRGRVGGADVTVAGNATTESYVSAVLHQSEGMDPGVRDDIRTGRQSLFEEGLPVETYRRLDVGGALGMLGSGVPLALSADQSLPGRSAGGR